MGQKEIFFLFLLSFCLLSYSLQAKTHTDTSTFASANSINVSYQR